MPDPAGFALPTATPITLPALRIEELPQHAKVIVRGRDASAALVEVVAAALGFAPPVAANTFTSEGPRAALWQAPGEWLAVGPLEEGATFAEALLRAVPRALAAVVDLSDAYVTIRIAGRAAPGVLAQGCPLDLHPRAFGPGRCAQSLLAKADILLWQRDEVPTFDVLVRRSYAEYLWRWLWVASRSLRSTPPDARSPSNFPPRPRTLTEL